jgi:SAM-dependent methyltransferase
MSLDDLIMRNLHEYPGYVDGYTDWQLNRVRFITTLYGPDFFKGKKVLEMGSFEGGITQMIYNLGGDITGVEGSDRNISLSRRRYPHLKFIQYDCDRTDEWAFDDHYDIIIHWGLLYHLKNEEASLDSCLKHTDTLLLETLLVDKTTSEIFEIQEDTSLCDQALNGTGTRATVKYVENMLDKFTTHRYDRYDSQSLDSRYQPFYSLPVGNTGEPRRKFWILKRCI